VRQLTADAAFNNAVKHDSVTKIPLFLLQTIGRSLPLETDCAETKDANEADGAAPQTSQEKVAASVKKESLGTAQQGNPTGAPRRKRLACLVR
jgi:hypothetical protein